MNVFKDVNTSIVALFRYVAALVNWTKSKIVKLDRNNKNELHINRGLLPLSWEARLQLPWKGAERGFIAAENYFAVGGVVTESANTE